ncbi:MAG: hypothetical protein FWF95_08045 [Syntrophorhabdaceae bacterium]|nr:hypothetical protein [Syntrophorhabdaceae bacterium]
MDNARNEPMARRRFAFFMAAILAAGLLGVGIFRKEFMETLQNAVLICLSCIGIG